MTATEPTAALGALHFGFRHICAALGTGVSISTLRSGLRDGNLHGVTPPRVEYTSKGTPWSSDQWIAHYKERLLEAAAEFGPREARGATRR